MTSGININVSGGGVSLGAVSQGDAAQVTGTANLSQTMLEQASRRSADVLEQLAREQGRSDDELREMLAAIEQLKVASQAPAREEGRAQAVGLLKLVRDNVSWAYPVIKDFVGVAWPALLELIGR